MRRVRGAYEVPSCGLAGVAHLVVRGQDEEDFGLRSHLGCQLVLECTAAVIATVEISRLVLEGQGQVSSGYGVYCGGTWRVLYSVSNFVDVLPATIVGEERPR